jgi:hypothetical protein
LDCEASRDDTRSRAQLVIVASVARDANRADGRTVCINNNQTACRRQGAQRCNNSKRRHEGRTLSSDVTDLPARYTKTKRSRRFGPCNLWSQNGRAVLPLDRNIMAASVNNHNSQRLQVKFTREKYGS